MNRRAFLAGAAAGILAARAEDTAVPAKTALVTDPVSRAHDTGDGHPECAARYDAVLNALKASGADDKMLTLPVRAATDEELARCHTREYIATARRDIEAGRDTLSTGDTQVSARSLEAALKASGAALNAVDAVVNGTAANAFCVARPPGHHATPERGMGFCVFNNVAVAARYAQTKHKIGKVLIADWDVHHGNGTQDIFYDDGSVFFLSTHQSPWYPGTGRADETGTGKGLGATLNFPFPASSGRKEIYGAFEAKLLPAMEKFKPEFVFISAGFDSRENDPLGKFTLNDEDFADLTRLMKKIAKDHANGRLVSVLEGGYNLDGLGKASAAHVAALMEPI
jgi:acetoin utilization deacetylase AcuC-like enzyme